MTKAAKARRRRAERAELAALREFSHRARFGGVYVQKWSLNDIDHARLDIASKLGCTIVMRHVGDKNWQVYAVKE